MTENEIRIFDGKKQVKQGKLWRPCCNFIGCKNRTSNKLCKKHTLFRKSINKIDILCYKFIIILKQKSLERKSYPKGNYKKNKDFPNYLIYDDGRVYSIIYKKFKKPDISESGYDRCSLQDNNEKYLKIGVHRLVAQHFIPNPNNYPIVDHINRIRTDNNVNNLQWVTQEMNQTNLSTNTSGITGLSYDKTHNKWVAGKKNIIRKSFDTKEEAIEYLNDPNNPKYHIKINKIIGISFDKPKWQVKLKNIPYKRFQNKINAIIYKFIHILKNKLSLSKSYPKGNYKKIKKFPNYLIYDDGRVYNIKSKKFRKLTPNQLGYISLVLANKGVSKGYSCHQLVAKYFIPNPNNYPIVDHINHIKTDNNVNNLRWVTPAMNNENLSSNTSGIPGVSYCNKYKIWNASKRGIKNKSFNTKEEAIGYLDNPTDPKYNTGIRKANKSGVTGLSYCNTHNVWQIHLLGIDTKSFKNKNDAIQYLNNPSDPKYHTGLQNNNSTGYNGISFRKNRKIYSVYIKNKIKYKEFITKQEAINYYNDPNNIKYCKRKNSTSGFKNITFITSENNWKFQTKNNNKIYQKRFKNKIDAICYKFIFNLKN